MKIVLIVNLFPPKWLAGTEIATYNIAKYLSKKGNDIHVITFCDKRSPKKEKMDNFFIHRVDVKKIRILGVLHFWFQILLVIKKINPEIIHVQSISAAIPGLLSKFLLRKPYIIWAQGSDVYLPDRLTKVISKIVLKNASIVIALSEDMKSKMTNICEKDKIIILQNGIEPEKFRDFKREPNNNIKKTILFVGTLRSVKGVNYLIEAMAIISTKLSTIDLLIVGDGPERAKLETLVKELNLQNCTHFEGKVSNEKIPEYMERADLFVLPSLSESFGIVNLEAMASGLPIVATNVGGLPEVVKNGENGLLVEPRNSKALAEKVLLLLDNIDLYNKISSINKENAKNYSWDKIAEKLEAVYRRICL
jgi:glycosyltransferase involved in cell wall biosynthesis